MESGPQRPRPLRAGPAQSPGHQPIRPLLIPELYFPWVLPPNQSGKAASEHRPGRTDAAPRRRAAARGRLCSQETVYQLVRLRSPDTPADILLAQRPWGSLGSCRAGVGRLSSLRPGQQSEAPGLRGREHVSHHRGLLSDEGQRRCRCTCCTVFRPRAQVPSPPAASFSPGLFPFAAIFSL